MVGALLELAAMIGGPVMLGWGASALHERIRSRRDRPQPVRNPVQTETTHDDVVTLADVVAHLTATGSTVADEFLTDEDRVDRRTFDPGVLAVSEDGVVGNLTYGAGVLLVPDDVGPLPVDLTAVDPLILRTSRPGAVRRLEHGTKAALAREAARVRRTAYHQLLRDRDARRAAAVPEPTVGPVGPSGVSSSWPAGMPPTGPAQGAGESRPAARPSPGRAGWH